MELSRCFRGCYLYTTPFWFGGNEMRAVKLPYLPLFFSFAFSHVRQIAEAGEFKRTVRPFKEHEGA
jgi:hypothetical protein